MSNTQDVKSALKTIEKRLENDEKLSKLLDDIERFLEGDERERAASSPRARLPYSSDSPICEAVWN